MEKDFSTLSIPKTRAIYRTNPSDRRFHIFQTEPNRILIFFSDKLTNIIQTVDFIENMKDMERFDEISKEFLELKSSIRFEPGPISQGYKYI